MLAHSWQLFVLNVVVRACAGQVCEVCSPVLHPFMQVEVQHRPTCRAGKSRSCQERVNYITLQFVPPGKQPQGKMLPRTWWEVPKTAFLSHLHRSSYCFCFIRVQQHWKYVTNYNDKGMEMCCNIPPSFPTLLPHRPSSDDRHLFKSLQKHPPPLLSAFPPIRLPWLWQTQLLHNGNQFHASAFILHWLHAVSHYVLCWNGMKSTFHLSMVNTFPSAAWRIANREHMVQCSLLFLFLLFVLHVLTRTPYSYTHSTFSPQRMWI